MRAHWRSVLKIGRGYDQRADLTSRFIKALAVVSFWLAPVWLGAPLAWTAHVLFDRAVGFGLRDDAGYIAR